MGDFEKRLIPFLSRYQASRARSFESEARSVDRAHITERSMSDTPIPPGARRGIQCDPMRATSVAFAVSLVACSDNSNPPPDYGNCVPVRDASCTVAFGGGGSTTGASSDSGAAPVGTAPSAATCGGADLLVATNNVYCDPCITGMCCQADTACTGQCESLLQCTLLCMQGDTVCVGTCENNSAVQAGVTAYVDFANCVTANCAGTCPNLQHN